MSEHDIIALSELDPNITLPWIIDEFDASFNELAQATLRYHLYHDGTVFPTHLVPIYEQLMEQIKSEIINTALKEGEALPSVRSLAGELRISALTVKKAYDKLEEEGFVTTIHGKGTYVTASDKQLALEARQREAEADFEKAIDRALAMGMSREDILETVTLLLEEK